MGVSASKTRLERRNSLLRRSQRKSIHGARAKADKLVKSIKKFKGTEENVDFIELKAKIEHLERELKIQIKGVQPELKSLHQDALKRTEECYQLLEDKLKANQDKLQQESKSHVDESTDEHQKDNSEEQSPFQVGNEPQIVQLKLLQIKPNAQSVAVEPIVESPQLNKRLSVMKIGVPVLPGTMLEALNKKRESTETNAENRITQIRGEIEQLEFEISRFVGQKNGRYYNKIKDRLYEYSRSLNSIAVTDDAIAEQVKLCQTYISSCLSFLTEKAVSQDINSHMEIRDANGVGGKDTSASRSLSPTSIRTTYI